MACPQELYQGPAIKTYSEMNNEVRYGHRLRDHGKYTALRQKNMNALKAVVDCAAVETA